MSELSKGLPRALKSVARDVEEEGFFPGSTSVYAYNKINAHVAGRTGLGESFSGAGAVNRRLVSAARKKPSMADVHRENAAKYRAARAERELRRMLESG